MEKSTHKSLFSNVVKVAFARALTFMLSLLNLCSKNSGSGSGKKNSWTWIYHQLTVSFGEIHLPSLDFSVEICKIMEVDYITSRFTHHFEILSISWENPVFMKRYTLSQLHILYLNYFISTQLIVTFLINGLLRNYLHHKKLSYPRENLPSEQPSSEDWKHHTLWSMLSLMPYQFWGRFLPPVYRKGS